jgi:hypothetical protein
MAYRPFTDRFSKSRQIATFMKRAIEEESIRSDGKAAIDDGAGGGGGSYYTATGIVTAATFNNATWNDHGEVIITLQY